MKGPAGGRGRSGAGLRLCLLGIGLIVAIGLAEAMLRLLWANPWAGIETERMVTLRLHPRSIDRTLDRAPIAPTDRRVRFRTDDRSYVMPSRRFDAPDATVAFMGGSTTEASLVQEPLRFPALVSTLLESRGLRINALNAGRSGSTLHDSFVVFVNHVVEDRPTAVVVMHATNDVGVLLRGGSYAAREGASLGLSGVGRYFLQAASSKLWLAGALRGAAAAPQLAPAPAAFPFDDAKADERLRRLAFDPYRNRLRAFVRTARAFDVIPVLMTEPLASVRNAFTPDWASVGHQDLFNGVIREVAREEGVPLVDLARLVADQPGWDVPMTVFYDGVHVTDAGSRLYARFIADVLETILTTRKPAGHNP